MGFERYPLIYSADRSAIGFEIEMKRMGEGDGEIDEGVRINREDTHEDRQYNGKSPLGPEK